eukprot:jgi/Mesvir1/6971/Mv09114-RA.1
MAPYDHHKKAGNPGDCVKHVALVAALDHAIRHLAREKGGYFRYCDTYAAYAWNPLVADPSVAAAEWTLGIAAVAGSLVGNRNAMENPHLSFWARHYSIPEFITAKGAAQAGSFKYPGSSRIAADVCVSKGARPHLTMYDISDAAVASLKAEFADYASSEPLDGTRIPDSVAGIARTIHRSADPADEGVQGADLLFIDPPNRVDHWGAILLFIRHRRAHQAVLIWLPIGKGSGE